MNNILNNLRLRNNEILKPIHWISIMLGCNTRSNFHRRDPRKIITLTIALISLVSVAAQINYIWQNRHKSILFYTDAICTALQCFISLTKILHLVLLQSKIAQMLEIVKISAVLQDMELLELDLPNKIFIVKEIEKLLNESWTNMKKQIDFFLIVVFGIVSWYFCYCSAINVYNKYISSEEFVPIYFFPAQFPKWYKNDTRIPHFLIEYTIVGTEWYVCSLGGPSYGIVFLTLSVHGLVLMKILCKLISYATNENYVPSKYRLDYIKCCIKLQQRIYNYYDHLNNMYKISTVPFFIITIFIKCLVIFQASLAGSTNRSLLFRSLLYFSATTFEVSIFCYNGQKLTTESCHLPFIIYGNKWYNENSNFKYFTQMMIARSQRIVTLTVGGFTTMSLVTLLGIMRTSASYFLLLKEVNEAV